MYFQREIFIREYFSFNEKHRCQAPQVRTNSPWNSMCPPPEPRVRIDRNHLMNDIQGLFDGISDRGVASSLKGNSNIPLK